MCRAKTVVSTKFQEKQIVELAKYVKPKLATKKMCRAEKICLPKFVEQKLFKYF